MLSANFAIYNVLAAYLLDIIIGDPRWLPHPVVGMGRFIERGEALLRRHLRREGVAGFILTGILVVGTYFLVKGVLSIGYHLHPWGGMVMEIFLIFTALSIKDLSIHAMDVHRAIASGDLSQARVLVARMVGRETQSLDESEIIRATVESVAESINDGVVAPLLYAFLGGAPLALSYKAVNTLDSMIGHKNERYMKFGWAAARLDDLANFIPARITGLLIPGAALILRKDFGQSFITILRDRKKHPSPNAGIPEAAIAGALGVKLGGTNYYQGRVEARPFIGKARVEFSPRHIKESIWLMQITSFLILIVGLGCYYFATNSLRIE